jgi:hypothetical protein
MITPANISKIFGCLLMSLAVAFPATAAEIWVPPLDKDPDKNVGDWAVTNNGDTRFSFSVPENLNTFVSAHLVVIGKKTTAISYDLLLSVSMDGKAHDDKTWSVSSLQADIEKDILSEIDVSPVFPPDLLPGDEYVSLHFDTFEARGDVRVVGLRFIYEADVDTLGGLGPGDYWKKTDVFHGDVSGTGDDLQLKPGVVGTPELATGSVSEPKLGFDTATQLELDMEASARSAGDAHFGDVSGFNNDLQIQPNTVGSPEIADNSVTSADVTNNSLTGADIQNNTLTGSDVADGSLTGADIKDGNITGADVAGGSLTGFHIQNGTVTKADILDEAGMDNDTQWSGIGDSESLSKTWKIMHTVHLTHQASGVVTCIAAGAFDWQNKTPSFARVGWTTESGTAGPPQYNFAQPEKSGVSKDGGPEIPVSTVHTFNVHGARTTTFYLKASQFAGEPGDVWYWRQTGVCMYFPTRM